MPDLLPERSTLGAAGHTERWTPKDRSSYSEQRGEGSWQPIPAGPVPCRGQRMEKSKPALASLASVDSADKFQKDPILGGRGSSCHWSSSSMMTSIQVTLTVKGNIRNIVLRKSPLT